jgi:GNAT superfamily N-acetyltransferase
MTARNGAASTAHDAGARNLQSIRPFFIVKDLQTSVAWYRERLGFQLDFQGPDGDSYYAGVSRDGVGIVLKAILPDVHPCPNHTRHEWARWDAYIHTLDPDALFDELNKRGVPFVQRLSFIDEGLWGFEISDADGYVLAFCQAREAQGYVIRSALPDDIDTLTAIDDDATALYAAYGLAIELAPEHPFARAERARWQQSAAHGRAFLAVDAAGKGLGLAVLDIVDDEPYLDQLAVRVSDMRRGIGRHLLERGTDWARAAGGSAIWLTTYDHLPFNRPFYERHGFVVVPDAACGRAIRHHLDEQRRVLPAAVHRVAMRRLL